MTGNEVDLRALVRDAVARHLGGRSDGGRPAEDGDPRASALAHASHGVYISLINVGEACLIEPDVACTHCQYCKSHGH